MKKELFALEKVRFEENGKKVFDGFNMFLYEGDVYGIICDSIIERNMLVEFFKGREEIAGGNIRFQHETIKQGVLVQMFAKVFSVIEKKSKLMNSLSLMENICIFVDKSKVVHKRQYYDMTKDLFAYFGIGIQPDKPVLMLTEKERVIIELVKAYAEDKRIIVLVDLSGFLQKNELSEVYSLLSIMKKKGYSFILIESFDDIVFNWTNRLLIIKNGKDQGCFEPRFIDRQKLYDFLTGKQKYSFKKPVTGVDGAEAAHTALRLEAVYTPELNNLTFSADKGEIVKIYFMNTGGMEAFRQIFFDGSVVQSGTVYLEEKKVLCSNIREWRKKGLCYSGELPYKNMLIQDMTVRDNLMLELAEKVGLLWMLPRYRKSVDQYIEANLGHDIANRRLRNLAPDILQKIQLGKYYLAAPKVLICEKPFLEVDLHIREVTLEMFAQLQNRGITIVVLTTNLSDLNLLEGNNIYIRNGSIVDENEIYQSLHSG